MASSPAPSTWILSLARATARVQDWIEQHPKTAWSIALVAVLAIVGLEVSFWPLNDYPGAMWHHTPRGDDIEVVQAHAAKAGWKDLWGYWFGRTIHGHGYYRPISSWLFVGEYRLWGTDDRTWAWVNIALHFGVIASLLWATWAILEGSQTRRLVTGVLATLLLGAPGLADRSVQSWIISWWPCQADPLSLLPGLWLMGAAIQFSRTGQRKWAVLAVGLFAFAVLVKEMGYIAGIGACLLLARRPTARKLLAVLVIEGAALYTLRWAALEHAGGVSNSPPATRQGTFLRLYFSSFGEMLRQISPQLIALVLGIVVVLVAIRLARGRRVTLGERVALGGVTYFVAAILMLGLPSEPLYQSSLWTLGVWGWRAVVLVGIALSVRHWPVPELIGIFLISVLAVSGYPPIFGWYQYWGSVFAALLSAVGIVTLGLLSWHRLVAPLTKSPAWQEASSLTANKASGGNYG